MRVLEPSPEAIEEAAALLRSGGLVGMPTETVYGLAGSIFLPDAVGKIFRAKNRPADNPLIVHIGEVDQLQLVALEVTPFAKRIVDHFWPGPVTVVLTKTDRVPSTVTGGGSTVAVRIPRHPIALELIRRSGHPLAAPSANKFMQLSPTRAQDVSAELGLEIVLDGGPCEVGIESTVVDCTSAIPVLLRPGTISREQLEAVLGIEVGLKGEGRRSPGQYPRHYAPRTPLRVEEQVGDEEGGLIFGPPKSSGQIQMPNDPRSYAAALYRSLHALDELSLDAIVVQAPPIGPEWVAVWDRLKRASTGS